MHHHHLMPKDETLACIEADLARGHTAVALRRLAGLTRSYPTDLEIRARRAAICRKIGDVVEAGRWGYIAADRRPDETAAFERAYSSADKRLRALRWSGDIGEAATDFAYRQLSVLQARPMKKDQEHAAEDEFRLRDALSCLLGVVIFILGAGIAVAGVIVLIKAVLAMEL